MPLVTLDQVKAKLQFPATYTDEDAALGLVRDAAEAYILGLTGFVLTSTPVEELVQEAQVGRPWVLTRRPVANVTATARVRGDTLWAPVAIDVLDATRGLVVLPPGAAWPPTAVPPRWAAWRQPAWDLVRVSYTATALAPVPAELTEATAQLAVAWWHLGRAGPVARSGVGPVTEEYAQRAIPPAVQTLLAPYLQRSTFAWA